MSDHIDAAERAWHGFTGKRDFVVHGTVARKNAQFFDVRVRNTQQQCGKINIRNNTFTSHIMTWVGNSIVIYEEIFCTHTII